MKRIMGSVVGAALVVGVLTVAGAQGPKDEESPGKFDLKPVDKK